MDKFFEKFGIYDFMGIWGPGAIILTYFLFGSGSFLSELFDVLNISSKNISQGSLLIFLYTVVSYTVGVVLNELGKLSFDHIALFDYEKIFYFDESLIKKKSIFPFKQIRYSYNRTIKNIRKNDILLKDILSEVTPIPFEVARSKLKYHRNLNTERMDVYHSIYALSRSLSIAFVIHIVCAIVSTLPCFTTIHVVIIVLDGILAYVFFVRAYRYFLSWIKNTYIQYFLCVWESNNDCK